MLLHKHMDYEYKNLEERMKQLPKELQQALTSVEISDTIKALGDRHDLKLDQEEALYDQTAYVMLGLSPSKDFVKNLSREAGIDEGTALAIAKEINTEVFDKMRSSMRSIEEKMSVAQTAAPAPQRAPQDNVSLERAGGFSIEPSLAADAEQGTVEVLNIDNETLMKPDGHLEKRGEILESIEHPEPAKQTLSPKDSAYTDPIVDHLLSGPTTASEQKVEHKTSEPPPNLPTQPPKPAPRQERGPDAYREPIE